MARDLMKNHSVVSSGVLVKNQAMVLLGGLKSLIWFYS